jgi:hypothetical protein
MLGVPASKRCGGGAKVVLSKATVRIMSPPPCHGGMWRSSSARP